MADYEVLVGNIGCVYKGTHGFDARVAYNTYVGQSKRGYGRAATEPVTLICDGEIVSEYGPPESEDS